MSAMAEPPCECPPTNEVHFQCGCVVCAECGDVLNDCASIIDCDRNDAVDFDDGSPLDYELDETYEQWRDSMD